MVDIRVVCNVEIVTIAKICTVTCMIINHKALFLTFECFNCSSRVQIFIFDNSEDKCTRVIRFVDTLRRKWNASKSTKDLVISLYNHKCSIFVVALIVESLTAKSINRGTQQESKFTVRRYFGGKAILKFFISEQQRTCDSWTCFWFNWANLIKLFKFLHFSWLFNEASEKFCRGLNYILSFACLNNIICIVQLFVLLKRIRHLVLKILHQSGVLSRNGQNILYIYLNQLALTLDWCIVFKAFVAEEFTIFLIKKWNIAVMLIANNPWLLLNDLPIIFDLIGFVKLPHLLDNFRVHFVRCGAYIAIYRK